VWWCTYRPSPWKLPSLPRDLASEAAFHTEGLNSEKIEARVVCTSIHQTHAIAHHHVN
jgi:hypothetical protein